MDNRRGYLRYMLLLLIFNGLILFMGWNGWVWLHSSFGFDQPFLYWVLWAMISYSYFFRKKSDIFRAVGSFWFGFFQYGVMLFPAADLIVWGITWGGVPLQEAIYYTGFLVIALFIGIFAFGMFNAYSPIIRRYQITVAKNKSRRKSLKLAVASDMHFGRLSGRGHAKRLIKKVNGIKPDLILLAGDIIDDDPEPFIGKNMHEIMAGLQAPLGVYGVPGNHDYYGGGISELVDVMRSINIQILMDETVKIEEDFYLVGRKDRMDRNRKPFTDLTSNLDKSYPIIALDHQPYELDNAEKSGVDVLLSGHTHRGQMAPNHLITKKIYELDWGYLKKGNLHAFVSSGFGFWGPPLRIGSRSEILEIDIKFI
ncbi:putative MPP superfamily phosphohydrolase [Peribacillus deserti]|uniref:MPP superfamily phosphohydrolase n=1 Tax=Peribacillus deserti TaxID=673318 RepID=A0ABS2QF42_9BACI|nr:metallophosphoesterase [Peribacillus deserti]MBM7691776.1 putative MPP superfamily phosphohydrolase [Peribacillus deserti]